MEMDIHLKITPESLRGLGALLNRAGELLGKAVESPGFDAGMQVAMQMVEAYRHRDEEDRPPPTPEEIQRMWDAAREARDGGPE